MFEPMFTEDGNLMVARVADSSFTWRSRRTNRIVTGVYDIVYFSAPVKPIPRLRYNPVARSKAPWTGDRGYIGGRIESVAQGGIHGKGLWMLGDGSRLVYNIDEQPRNIRNSNWHISLFVGTLW